MVQWPDPYPDENMVGDPEAGRQSGRIVPSHFFVSGRMGSFWDHASVGGFRGPGLRWVLGAEIVSERCQHRDKPVALIRHGEDAECVESIWSVGDGRK